MRATGELQDGNKLIPFFPHSLQVPAAKHHATLTLVDAHVGQPVVLRNVHNQPLGLRETST